MASVESEHEPEQQIAAHRQCAWCGRLKHPNGSPHGSPLPLEVSRHSHGVCTECAAALLKRHVAARGIQSDRVGKLDAGKGPRSDEER